VNEHANTHWEATVSAALLGVNNRRPAQLDADPVIAKYLSAQQDPATAVLHTAALTATARNASGPPRVEATAIAEAPADDRPELSETAARALAHALEAAAPLRYRMLRRVAEAHRRPPAAMLVPLLRTALRDTAAREAVVRIVGARGAWIAEKTSDIGWSGLLLAELYGTPEGNSDRDEQLWTHGIVAQRVMYLTGLRRRDPAAALALLTGGWRSETGPDREQLLSALETGLSAADEPFLEACLRDSRKKVRATAQRQLALIPESGLQRRLQTLVAPHVRLGRSLLRATTLTFTTPSGDELAAASADRYGISTAGNASGANSNGVNTNGANSKQWVTAQLLGRITLPFWEAHLGAAPEKIVSAVSLEDAVRVIPALSEAALVQGDRRWATALLKHPTAPVSLFAIADPACVADVVIDRLRRGDVVGLDHLPVPWPPAVATAVFDAFDAMHRRHRTLTPEGHTMLLHLPVGLPLDIDWGRRILALHEAATAGMWTNHLAIFDEALHIRTVLERELT
jgi:hypothetical protein